MNLDGIIEDYPNTTTPLSKAVLTNLANAILGVAFPIGKIEMFYDAEDHSNYMGFTWESTAVGKVLVGIDSTDTDFNTIGKTGGSKEMQKHTHTYTGLPNYGNQAINWGSDKEAISYAYLPSSAETSIRATAIKSAGTGTSGNLQPYQVVAFWKRIG